MRESNWADCCRRLDLIARLLVRNSLKDGDLPEQDLVADLTNMGFVAKEMGTLLGKTPNAIKIMQTRLRKKGFLKGAKSGK